MHSPSRLTPALLLAGALVTFAPAQSASAAPRPATDPLCPFTDTLCLFEGENFTGERFTVKALDSEQGACVDLVDHGWGGRARSAVNTDDRNAAMFPNADCTGHPAPIAPGRTPDFSGWFTPGSVFVH
ncbi:peptidase inhibitor family I36 protein [Actinomadura algeriensis]|uniref:Peptidase inhibitor family I36 n=1 Tax=Actinomadura algeriensis TaxID=1679523 RepID=A0ABR9JJ50_9ACTN|nr:peptidase inhibitor family I36 protein [Actinomadura algeriensis]MBE1530489.1 hypothetical protein [Actinomadura algeriensis]